MTSSRPSSIAPEHAGDRRLTLAVMARPPVPGRCKTRLAEGIGAAGAARLYEAMLLDTLHGLARIPGRHVVLAAPENDGVAALRRLAPEPWEIVEQRGADLGERLANGMRDLWQGHLLCLLDSDSPTLPFDRLAETLAQPREEKTVIVGPCDDGGYYLIGSTSLETGIFDAIPWSTAAVMESTRARCATLGLAIEALPTGFDVDSAADLVRLRAELARDPAAAPRTAACLAVLDARRGDTP